MTRAFVRHSVVRSLVVAALLCGASPTLASDPGSRDAGSMLIEELIELVRENYILAERVEAIEGRLREALEEGRYAPAKDAAELAALVMEDLRASSRDLHFGIRPRPEASGVEGPAASGAGGGTGPVPTSTGVGRVEILDGGLGYLEFRGFVDPARGGPALDAAFAQLSETAALIVDLRTSAGGHPGMVAYAYSYFFDRPSFLFNRLEWRNSGEELEMWTRDDLPSPRYASRPVFVLTSSSTASAAEGLAYHLKHAPRATLVGETTVGGAHTTKTYEVGGFQVAIPTGRALSTITGNNWEGRGVVPDVEVEADEALEVALRMAGRAGLAEGVEAEPGGR